MHQPKSLDTGASETAIKIERQSLHDAILNRLRDMIIEGELAPGLRVNEGQMGNMLGVSRTPLREALKTLAGEGLIELIPSRGAVIKKFTPKEVRDMMDVVRTLEDTASRRACMVATNDGIAAVRALHDEMIDCYHRGDRLRYYKLNQEIHTAIVALADNAALSDVHSLLQTRLKRIRFIGHEGPEKWSRAVAEHEEMIAALEARDVERLTAVINTHLREAWERVKDSLKE